MVSIGSLRFGNTQARGGSIGRRDLEHRGLDTALGPFRTAGVSRAACEHRYTADRPENSTTSVDANCAMTISGSQRALRWREMDPNYRSPGRERVIPFRDWEAGNGHGFNRRRSRDW
jgi:hypothetical protein